MDIRNPVLAICVAGTPAPGINGVISAVTIEALNSGCSVLGFYEGFKQMKAGKSMVQSLEWNDVTRIYNKGGSILRTSKHQITNAQELDNCLRVLEHHRVRYLVAIGGTQTAYSASLIASASKKSRLPLSVVHVPKTVFNDLPLPADCRTFGYSTAREEGMKLVQNFANDARTMLRWYILVCMGQKAGHLSLGIGKAGAATLTLIPEDYEGRTITFNELATTLEATMIKRRAMNKDYGVVVLAEGLSDLMDKKEIAERFGNADNGHQELGRHLVLEISQRFKANGIDMTLVCRNIGNELRSADPNSADIILTRDLGFGATRFLMEGGNNCMITYKGGSIYPIPLSEMLDIANSSTLIRCVDVNEMTYQVAQSYMIKLMQSDLADMAVLTSLAKAGNMTPAEFVQRFKSVAQAAKQYQSVGALQYSLRSSTSESRLSISGGVHTPSGSFGPPSGSITPVGSVTFTSTPLSVESAQQALNADVSVEHTVQVTGKQSFLPTD